MKKRIIALLHSLYTDCKIVYLQHTKYNVSIRANIGYLINAVAYSFYCFKHKDFFNDDEFGINPILLDDE